MKTIVLILIYCTCSCALAGEEEEPCFFQPGYQPIPVINSQYKYVNGNFCCPQKKANKHCNWTDKEMDCLCPHGAVLDPCLNCKTCASGLGEVCGGKDILRGRCAEGLVCRLSDGSVLELKNRIVNEEDVSGYCSLPDVHMEQPQAERKKEFEECDGIRSICMEGHKCTLIGGIKSICINSSTSLRDNCMQDCLEKKASTRCGSDGVLYFNACQRRQQNCFHPHTVVRKEDNLTKCNNYCQICKKNAATAPNMVISHYFRSCEKSTVSFKCKEGTRKIDDFPDVHCDCTSEGDTISCDWKYEFSGRKFAWNGNWRNVCKVEKKVEDISDKCQEIRENSQPLPEITTLAPGVFDPPPATTTPEPDTPPKNKGKVAHKKQD